MRSINLLTFQQNLNKELKGEIIPLYSCLEEAKKIGSIHSENSIMRKEIKQMK